MRHAALCLYCFFSFALPASALDYRTFSLKVARQRVESAGQNWRQKETEVWKLADINKVEGFVYDQNNDDLILVGQYVEGRSPLTLDDLAVALRARLRYDKWPEVSIDPTPDTEKTQMQCVRFEGGIADTAFGNALFEADYQLKKVSMGLVDAGVPGFRTEWERAIDEARKQTGRAKTHILSRYWFYPVNPQVVVRKDVCAVQGLSVGVFTEVLSAEIDGIVVKDPRSFSHPVADAFVCDVTRRFDDLCRVHPSFNRLRGLEELVSVTKALEQLAPRPDLAWWFDEYKIQDVKTPRAAKVLRRDWAEFPSSLQVEGGVHLEAIALRLQAGDVTALRDAVLKHRPTPIALTWEFVVGQWIIPLTPGTLRLEEVAPLVQQAWFLFEQRRYHESATLYSRVLNGFPDLGAAYVGRGLARAYNRDYERAIADYDTALRLGPALPAVYVLRGAARGMNGSLPDAMKDFEQALQVDARFAPAYFMRGVLHNERNNTDAAIADFRKCIEIKGSSQDAMVCAALGNALMKKHDFQAGLRQAEKAIELDPTFPHPHADLALCRAMDRNFADAHEHLNRAFALARTASRSEDIGAENWHLWALKGMIHAAEGNRAAAIESLRTYIDRAPPDWVKFVKMDEFRDMKRRLESGETIEPFALGSGRGSGLSGKLESVIVVAIAVVIVIVFFRAVVR